MKPIISLREGSGRVSPARGEAEIELRYPTGWGEGDAIWSARGDEIGMEIVRI